MEIGVSFTVVSLIPHGIVLARLLLSGEGPKELCEVGGLSQQLLFLPALMTVQGSGVGSSGKSL